MRNRVYQVETVQIKQVTDRLEGTKGVELFALGMVPTSGWSKPSLDPWMYVAPPDDGVLDMDFTALQPGGFVLEVLSKVSLVVTTPFPAWVRGVRVHGAHGSVEAFLDSAEIEIDDEETTPNAVRSPWPFPWWSPNTPVRG